MALELKQKMDTHLQRIVNVLLLNASFIPNHGLLNGKMGIAIFIYHYARYTKNAIYTCYAGELIDEIYEEINKNTPIDFADGLTGIGWGIEYLAKNGFVEADTDKALAEIDATISQVITEGVWDNLTLQHLADCGYYFISRLKEKDSGKILFNKKHNLLLLLSECERNFVFKGLEKVVEFPSHMVINQLFYFILQLHKTGLFRIKTHRLLQLFPSLLFSANSLKPCDVEVDSTSKLVKQYQILLEECELGAQFKEIIIALKIKGTAPVSPIKEMETILKSNLNRILFGIGEADQSNNNKLVDYFTGDTNLSNLIDKIDKERLSLNIGIAGIGMNILNIADLNLQKRIK